MFGQSVDMLFYFGNLTRDPSRDVRMGLKSLLDSLICFPYIKIKILGIGIAYYCLLPIGLPIGLYQHRQKP